MHIYIYIYIRYKYKGIEYFILHEIFQSGVKAGLVSVHCTPHCIFMAYIFVITFFYSYTLLIVQCICMFVSGVKSFNSFRVTVAEILKLSTQLPWTFSQNIFILYALNMSQFAIHVFLFRCVVNPFVPTVAFSQLSSNMCCPRD